MNTYTDNYNKRKETILMAPETAHYKTLETKHYQKQAEEELAAFRHQIVQIMADLGENWPLEVKLRSISGHMRLAQTYLDQASMSNALFTVLDERERMKPIWVEAEVEDENDNELPSSPGGAASTSLAGESEELSLGL